MAIKTELDVIQQLEDMQCTLALGFNNLANARIADIKRHEPILDGKQWRFAMPTIKEIAISESLHTSDIASTSDSTDSTDRYECPKCGFYASNCTCTESSFGSRRSTNYAGTTIILDDASQIPVEYVLGSGAETTCYSMIGTDDVLLVVSAGSYDKDVMSELHTLGYEHTLKVTYLGYTVGCSSKVYRAERITGIGNDPEGIASAIRAFWPYTPTYASIRKSLDYLPRSVVITLVAMLRKYKTLGGQKPRLDLHRGNFATLPDGRFILLDPFFRG